MNTTRRLVRYRTPDGTCSVSGCTAARYRRGWCRLHDCPTPALDYFEATIDELLANPSDECARWPFGKSNGYGVINLSEGKRQRHVGVHRLACELAHGPCPPGMQTCHAPKRLCGHRDCFNPRHVRWDTPKSNSADRVADGTASKWLLRHQVNLIRQRLAAGESAVRVAQVYGVTPTTVGNIRRGETWARLPARRAIRRRRSTAP